MNSASEAKTVSINSVTCVSLNQINMAKIYPIQIKKHENIAGT